MSNSGINPSATASLSGRGEGGDVRVKLVEAGLIHPFEHLEVFRDRLQAHLEGFGQLVDGRLALGESGEDRPTSRIGKGGERDAEPGDYIRAVTESVGNLHPEFRAFWHPVAWSSEVGSKPFPTTLLGEPLVAVRRQDGIVAVFGDQCPHRGAPLSYGRLENGELVCPFHGWRFSADGGQATVIPSLGPGAILPSRACLARPADVTERLGMVWVALEPPQLPLPTWPDFDAGYAAFSPTAHTSAILAAYQTDNLLDASHFPFLHGSLGARNPLIDAYELVDEHGLGFSTVLRKLADDNVTTEGWLRYSCTAPFTVTLRSEEPDGTLRNSFMQVIQPISATHTRMFFQVRVPQTDATSLAEMLEVEEAVQREDLWITSAQRRTGMPLGGTVDLHVRSDRNGVLFRKVMRNLFSGHP